MTMIISNVYIVLFIISAILWTNVQGNHIVKSNQEVKIVNGDEVKPHSFTYMAAIRTNIDEKSTFCGGSLIATSLVLTAARCLSGASEAEVILGAHNINEAEDSQIIMTSSEFVIHPNYTKDSLLYDIALIQLPSAVTLNENITTVDIPKSSDVPTSYNELEGLVSGWGKTKDTDNSISSVLHAVNVTIIPTLICELSYLFSISFDQMCTSGVSRKNICLGDSGGPLVIDGVQVGIASFGSDFGCEVGFPGVFTRMTSYVSWLSSNINIYAEND